LLEPTGRLTASCTGTFHFKQPPLAASTAHIDCQAKLVTSSRTSYAPMSISMQYRRNPFYIDQCDLVPCEDPPSRNYGLIGTYFKQ
jgi:hypothetical protein